MIGAEKILLTGGTGRLGTALRELLPGLIAPGREELDITDLSSVERALERYQPQVVVHAAAYTDVARAETEKALCWKVNVGGTRNMVRAALNHPLHFVHISSDYVFWGDVGSYKEDDPVGPVRNYYALSKLAAEEVVRVLPKYLILRTSFRPSPFPYPVAFEDMFTSQDYLEVIAPEIALAIRNLDSISYDTLHIATKRKSIYVLAQQTRPDVRSGSRLSSSLELPEDVSLDLSRWQNLKVLTFGKL